MQASDELYARMHAGLKQLGELLSTCDAVWAWNERNIDALHNLTLAVTLQAMTAFVAPRKKLSQLLSLVKPRTPACDS